VLFCDLRAVRLLHAAATSGAIRFRAPIPPPCLRSDLVTLGQAIAGQGAGSGPWPARLSATGRREWTFSRTSHLASLEPEAEPTPRRIVADCLANCRRRAKNYLSPTILARVRPCCLGVNCYPRVPGRARPAFNRPIRTKRANFRLRSSHSCLPRPSPLRHHRLASSLTLSDLEVASGVPTCSKFHIRLRTPVFYDVARPVNAASIVAPLVFETVSDLETHRDHALLADLSPENGRSRWLAAHQEVIVFPIPNSRSRTAGLSQPRPWSLISAIIARARCVRRLVGVRSIAAVACRGRRGSAGGGFRLSLRSERIRRHRECTHLVSTGAGRVIAPNTAHTRHAPRPNSSYGSPPSHSPRSSRGTCPRARAEPPPRLMAGLVGTGFFPSLSAGWSYDPRLHHVFLQIPGTRRDRPIFKIGSPRAGPSRRIEVCSADPRVFSWSQAPVNAAEAGTGSARPLTGFVPGDLRGLQVDSLDLGVLPGRLASTISRMVAGRFPDMSRIVRHIARAGRGSSPLGGRGCRPASARSGAGAPGQCTNVIGLRITVQSRLPRRQACSSISPIRLRPCPIRPLNLLQIELLTPAIASG